ncbi:DNA-3-methyladenine glycosylase [Aestuariivirga sp.]|uniref:DNA-3-methyladenine glycosylase family protein n=1 Tax=Aestuariivirga sp. TaxID=2650926 RepID=UPI003592F6CD
MVRISTVEELQKAVDHLVRIEPKFRAIVLRHGLPSLRHSEPGLASLLRIVTDQLISLKAGEAIWKRLAAHLAPFEPDAIIACGYDQLKALGLSGAKARCFLAAAEGYASGQIDNDVLARLSADEAAEHLMAIRGVGPWTADIYLLSALQVADAWPAADLALQVAAQELLHLPVRPSSKDMIAMASGWRPYRAAAARLLWSHYRGLKQMPQAPI